MNLDDLKQMKEGHKGKKLEDFGYNVITAVVSGKRNYHSHEASRKGCNLTGEEKGEFEYIYEKYTFKEVRAVELKKRKIKN